MTEKSHKIGYTRVTDVSGSLYVVIPNKYAKEHNITHGSYLKRIESDDKIEFIILKEVE